MSTNATESTPTPSDGPRVHRDEPGLRGDCEPRNDDDGNAGGAGRFALAGAAASMWNVALAVIRSKIVAETLGPVGVGIAAEVTQVLALLQVIATVAHGPALLKWLAETLRAGERERLERGVGTAVVLAATLTAVPGVLCVALGPAVLPSDWPIDVRLALALTAISMSFNAIAACVTQVHVSLADLRAITLSQMLGALLATAALVALVLWLGLEGQFVALAVGSGLGLAVTWWLLRRRRAPVVRVRWAWDREFVRQAFTIGTTALVSGYVAQLLLSSMRLALEHAGSGSDGADYNGNFQAAYAVGTTYFSAVLSGIGTYYFPRYAAARDAGELTREVHAAADFVLRHTPVLAFSAIAFRDVIIHALYSDRFALAAEMLGYMLAADVARVVSWSYAGPLPMRGRARAFLVTEGAAFVLGAAFAWIAIGMLGPVGVGIGILATNVVYVVFAALVTQASCGVAVRWSHIARAILLAFGAAAFNLAVAQWAWGRWASLPLLAFWAWRAGHVARVARALRRLRERLRLQPRRVGQSCRG